MTLADTLVHRVTTFYTKFKFPTPVAKDHDPLSLAIRKAIVDENNLAISMRDIVATVASDVDSDVKTLQEWRSLDASNINGMNLDSADHATHSQAPVVVFPPPQLSADELTDR